MCAIVGSFDSKRFKALWNLNSHRGSHSYSFAIFDPAKGEMLSLQKGLGALPDELPTIPLGTYAIGHCQAPTSESAREHIHPAQREGAMLWHNGIIKAARIRELQKAWGLSEQWDTALLLAALLNGKSLSDIDGSFACLMFSEKRLQFFRNELCPLYFDPQSFDLSSTTFPHAKSVTANVVWTLNFANKSLDQLTTFQTKENPYLL